MDLAPFSKQEQSSDAPISRLVLSTIVQFDPLWTIRQISLDILSIHEIPSMPTSPTASSEPRQAFARRLRELRHTLGYTQGELAHALGIKAARYSKYEIGRSEAGYELLTKLSKLTGIDLNYLITGTDCGALPGSPQIEAQFAHLLKLVPTPVVIFDGFHRLLDCNRRYREMFFPNCPSLAKKGTPLGVLARAWGYAQGFSVEEIEEFIGKRLDIDAFLSSPVELQVGKKVLHFNETLEADCRISFITDVTDLRR